MGRHRNTVYAKTLAQVKAARLPGRPSRKPPWQFYLTFERSYGLGTLLNREISTVISGREAASIISAIPREAVRDEDDYKAVLRVMDLLQGPDFNRRQS